MRFFFLLLLLMVSKSAAAKDFPMLHYTIEDGLPSNTIYDIYQDSDGMIWIGTDKGVSRFNGIKFENFTTDDGLSDNECFYFRPDQNGRLWIACFNGQLCYYKNGKFHNPRNTSWLKIPNPSYFREIKILSDNSIAFFNTKEPIIYILRKNNFKTINYKNNKSKSLIDVRAVGGGKYLLFYEDEINFVESGEIKGSRAIKYIIKAAMFDRNKTFYITKNNKILDSNLELLNFGSSYKTTKTLIYRLTSNNKHKIISTGNGVYIDSLDVILTNLNIHSTIIDKNEDYWIGSKQNGIYRLSNSHKIFSKKSNAFNAPIIFANLNSGKLIWATNEGDLFKETDDSVKLIYSIKYFLENPARIVNEYYINKKKNVEIGKIWTDYKLMLYRQAYIEENKQLNIDPKYKSNEHIIPVTLTKGVSDMTMTDSLVYFKGRFNLWIMNRGEFLQKKSIYHTRSVINGEKKDFGAIFGWSKDKKGNIWLSTLKSIYIIVDTQIVKQRQFDGYAFREFKLFDDKIIAITHSNNLLICSKIYSNKIIVDTIKDQSSIWDKICTLNDSTFLISSNNYPRILKIKNSKSKNNYQINVLENPFLPFQPEYVFSDSSYIFFFKKREISSFPIDYVIEKKPLPTIKFSTLQTDKFENAITDTVKLQYEQSKNLKIRFVPISFYHQNLSYEYRIFEKDKPGTWTSFEGEELNLIKIGYGNFTIQVRAKTLSGDYSKAASFILIVQKPYWATWWFVSLIFIFLILIVAVLARFGIKQRLKKKEGEVRFLRSEYKALNALMNPHFIFNSLNSVQSLINNNENTTASKYIRIFSDLIRQNMRNIANDLIPLSKELDLVENYLKIEQLRFKEHLSYTIDIQDDIETEMIMVPPLLIQPLVENAIKHGIWPKKSNDGCIQIRIGEIGTELKIEIEDNGNGFNATKKTDTLHESYAMRNIEQRIEQLSQIHSTQINIEIIEKKDENGKVIGVVSTVTIQMPN